MTYFLLNGIVLGFAAGLTPGPLMALILTETLAGGWPAGFRVSLAPLVTDSTLIALAWLLAAPLPPWGIAAISVIGGAIIIWMGISTMRSGSPKMVTLNGAPGGSFRKAIVVNLINPFAFVFWLTNGVPILKESITAFGRPGPALFMAPFFLVMISVNLVLAFGVSKSRQFLEGVGYRWALRGAGAMLTVMGLWRIWKGLLGL